HSELSDAALPEAGSLLGGKSRSLCARRPQLHALYFAHPPLSRLNRAPHSERCSPSRRRGSRRRGAGGPLLGNERFLKEGNFNQRDNAALASHRRSFPLVQAPRPC